MSLSRFYQKEILKIGLQCVCGSQASLLTSCLLVWLNNNLLLRTKTTSISATTTTGTTCLKFRLILWSFLYSFNETSMFFSTLVRFRTVPSWFKRILKLCNVFFVLHRWQPGLHCTSPMIEEIAFPVCYEGILVFSALIWWACFACLQARSAMSRP